MDNINNQDNKNSSHNPFTEQAIAKTKNNIFGFFITRTRLVILMLIAIIFGGILALTHIPRESDPEVKIPIAIVTTVYPGASPADIENLITDEIENKLENLEDVKLITSTSKTGVSSIVIEFDASANLDDSIKALKDKVNEVTGLPDEAEDPMVTPIRANDSPIITFSLAGDLSDAQLKQLGEIIQDDLEKIPGISEVPLAGTRQREFLVTVDKTSLNRLQISLGSVVAAISMANVDMPLGNLTIDSVDYNLRAVAKFTSLEDLKKVVITNKTGTSILLSDIAKVEDDFADKQTVSRISIAGQPVVNTVSLQVFKKTGGNILNIVDSAKERIVEMQKEKIIPTNVAVEISNDFSFFIREDLNNLGRSGIQATILIFILLFLALSIKEAVISLAAIPLTFLITFFFLNALGYTLNSLSLFTLVLSLGLLVDSFIIILEGIFHNMRRGYNSLEASLIAVSHYHKPLISGILTTVAAFVPMLLVSGILGEYLKVLPITITITLLSALFVSLIIVPALSKVFLKHRQINKQLKHSYLERFLTDRLRAWYKIKVFNFLANRKAKIKFAIIILVVFLTSLGLLIGNVIPVKLFPEVNLEFGFINVEMPIGTDLEKTEAVVTEIENYLYNRSDVKSFVTTIGQSSSFGFDRSSTNEHLANLSINFTDIDKREKKSYEIGEEIRKDLSYIQEGKITIESISSGPPTGAPIEARISGHDLVVLDKLNNQVINYLSETEGVINVSSNQNASPADLTFTLNREALAQAGLSVGEVSGFLRTAIFGVTATEISINNEDINAVVQLDQNTIGSIEEIKNLSIINNLGQDVKLSRLADFSLEASLATLRHRDFQRTVTINADVKPDFTANDIVNEITKKIAKDNITPKGYTISFGGEVEDIQQSFSELWNAMIIAVLLILTILVLQFNSFKTPLVIFITLPLMLIGVVVGMLLINLPFSFAVFLGLISLTGIVVNDAIVLIDKTRRNIKEKKMLPRDAVVDAGDSRLQPILLTSITTIIGVVPLALADEFWLGLSISVIFGLSFATILQLFVIPMVFLQLEGKNILKERQNNQDLH